MEQYRKDFSAPGAEDLTTLGLAFRKTSVPVSLKHFRYPQHAQRKCFPCRYEAFEEAPQRVLSLRDVSFEADSGHCYSKQDVG